MIKVDVKEIRKFERNLSKFATKAVPQATKWVINTAAWDAREKAQALIKQKMITRNTYTVRSVQVDKTNSNNISTQESRVGSIAEYMKRQELGGTRTSKGGGNVHIPTSFSAGQSITSQPRMKMPRGENKLASINLRKKRQKFYSKKQHNFVVIKMAAKLYQQYVYLDLPSSKGIFKITGGKRKRELKMVHDMTLKSVSNKSNPWLYPAVEKVRSKIPRMYLTALKHQMKKHNLF